MSARNRVMSGKRIKTCNRSLDSKSYKSERVQTRRSYTSHILQLMHPYCVFLRAHKRSIQPYWDKILSVVQKSTFYYRCSICNTSVTAQTLQALRNDAKYWFSLRKFCSSTKWAIPLLDPVPLLPPNFITSKKTLSGWENHPPNGGYVRAAHGLTGDTLPTFFTALLKSPAPPRLPFSGRRIFGIRMLCIRRSIFVRQEPW